MAGLTCQVVRPDKLMVEAPCTGVVLYTHTGELGVFPGHAAEVVALGSGVMRVYHDDAAEESDRVRRVVISGGYAEISHDTVIVLAQHARMIDDIEPEVVKATREKALAARDALPEGDHGRRYYEKKAAWCDLLLAEHEKAQASLQA